MARAAIHIPGFLVQAVVRAEPALRGAAIALVDGTPPLWNVVAANPAAARTGIELGIARTLAEQFETVQIRPRSRTQEKAAHAALLDLGWSVSPRVEDTAPDTIAIDLAGLSSLFGSEEAIAHQLAQRASELGLIAQVAVASNLEAAIHAARGFPGITLIPQGEEAQFLGCLPIGVLGASAETLETLERWGVRTCEALAALPVLQLSERLGQEGVRLLEWARGAGVLSMVLAEPGMCFEEEMELDDSVEELEPLAFLLGRLLDQLCARLQARSLAICAIHLRLDLDPAGKKDLQVRNDSSRRKNKSNMYKKVLTLPVPMRDSKMLLNLLRLQLQGDPPSAPILKIFMAAEPARPRAVQTGLFLPASPDVEKLELTIARLVNLVGDSNIGSPQLVDTHRPGEFRMDRFIPSREGPKLSRHKNAVRSVEMKCSDFTANSKTARPAIGFRMFRPPLPANVQLQEGRPQRVSFRGTRGEVVAASGPWRTSGDWWREDAWHQDEWDLEIRFQIPSSRLGRNLASCPQQGLYRFYYDSISQGWFVRGIYD
jgi:protein ImuB